jgi:CheY-like chemotaxis protein
MKPNEEKSQGNTNTFTLALTVSHALARSQPLARRGLNDLEGFPHGAPKTIFTVDDEKNIGVWLCSVLATAKYTCRAFESGVEVLNLLESGAQCDLLITGLMMPSINGLTLLQNVRKGYPELPVIFLSGVRNSELQLECLDSGAFRFLHKPCTARRLLDVVSLALEAGADLGGLQHGAGETIFYVEDDKLIRDFICSMLATTGYTCRAFESGIEVLNLLESGAQCDLLITGLMMPSINGLTLLQNVRERHPELPVIVASTVFYPETQQECLDLGAFRFVQLRQLPFDPPELLDVVTLALR